MEADRLGQLDFWSANYHSGEGAAMTAIGWVLIGISALTLIGCVALAAVSFLTRQLDQAWRDQHDEYGADNAPRS